MAIAESQIPTLYVSNRSGTTIKAVEPQQEPKKREGRKLPKVIPSEGVKKILAQPNTETKSGLKNRAILEALYRAGLRVAELTNLAPADVNIDAGRIYVQQGKGSKDRYIPIGPTLMKWLKKWNEIRPESDYFFCTGKGGQLDTRQIREMCYRMSRKAGVYIQDGKEKILVSPHKWRHTYASGLLNRGMNIRKVQQLLGHKKVTTTEIYTEVNMDELDREIKAID